MRPIRLPMIIPLAALVIAGAVAVARLALAAPQAPAAAEFKEPAAIIRDEGRFLFTDGSSYYLFRKDGTFASGPVGLSGREIKGKWELRDRLFVIEGQWGWVNGISPLDDYRRMTLYVGTPTSAEVVKNLSFVTADENAKVYKSYFIIEELQKLPKHP